MNRLTSMFENDIIDQVSMDFIANESYDDIIDNINESYNDKKSKEIHLFESEGEVEELYNATDDDEYEEDFNMDDDIDIANDEVI